MPRRPSSTQKKRSPSSAGKKVAHDTERLQKVLAAAGIGSRRACEELILAGRIEVDRKVVTEMGTQVNPDRQEIRVDGSPLPQRKRVYYMLNKPPGVVSTSSDPSGRQRVIDLVPSHDRLFTVGRLDMSSEGLILVTNDGELANRLTHPRYEIEKNYIVETAGAVEPETVRQLRRGVYLAEAIVRMDQVRVKRRSQRTTSLEMVLTEGRNREIRRALARLGHKVLRLRRVALGPLRLGQLPLGAYRELSQREIRKLQQATALERAPVGRKPRSRRPAKSAEESSEEPRKATQRTTDSERTATTRGTRSTRDKKGTTPAKRASSGRSSSARGSSSKGSSSKGSSSKGSSSKGSSSKGSSTKGGSSKKRDSKRGASAKQRPAKKTTKKKLTKKSSGPKKKQASKTASRKPKRKGTGKKR